MKFEHILVPVDFSDFSEKAIHYAAAMAQKYNSRLTLVHVSDSWDEDDTRSKELLNMYTETLHSAGLNVQSRGVNGSNAGEAIVDLITEAHGNVVVMGTHGTGGFTKMSFGSVTEYVIRHSSKPVLTIHKNFNTSAIKKILIPVDFSKPNSAAAQFCTDLVTDDTAEIHCLQVINTELHPEYSHGRYRSFMRANPGLVGRLQKKMEQFPCYGNMKKVFVLKEGMPHLEIQEYAEKHDISLIALAVRGMSNMEHLFLNNRAEQVLGHGPCLFSQFLEEDRINRKADG